MSSTHDFLDDESQDDEFHQTLENLGAKNLFDDEETIKNLWMKLRDNDPILLRQFEDFLKKTTDEIKRSKSEHQNFETTLKSKTSLYNDEIKRLYDEMEQQLNVEKAILLEQVKSTKKENFLKIKQNETFFFVVKKERTKERELREQMEEELHLKEEELAETIRKQTELELKFLQSNSNENEIRNENERLQKVTKSISFLRSNFSI